MAVTQQTLALADVVEEREGEEEEEKLYQRTSDNVIRRRKDAAFQPTDRWAHILCSVSGPTRQLRCSSPRRLALPDSVRVFAARTPPSSSDSISPRA